MLTLAADQPATGGGSFMTIAFLVLIVGAMYFLMIRPQNKRRREAMEMQSKLAPGDEVQTVGGLYATVTAVDDDSVTLEAAPGIELRYARGAISRVTARAHSDDPESSEESEAATPIEKA